MKLLIISHSEHFRKDGQIVGWGPTVREINHLTAIFDEIYHIACMHDGKTPASALAYNSEKIHYIPIPAYGGPGILKKVKILWVAPLIIYTVFKTLKKTDFYQFRAPTAMGIYLIPLLHWFSSKKGWYKYAGNWMEARPPLSYRIQKWWLTFFKNVKVTLNGKWPGQPANQYSFENPCLDNAERQAGLELLANKSFEPPYRFCFVGRLEEEKGVGRIIEAMTPALAPLLDYVWLIGDGVKRAEFEANAAQKAGINFKFQGSMSRFEIVEVYKSCHFILLPSLASEGFPKVLAEAMNYGCIPICSSISSIPHYITNADNGFLWEPGAASFKAFLEKILHLSNSDTLLQLAKAGYQTAEAFTFEHYLNRIANDILQ